MRASGAGIVFKSIRGEALLALVGELLVPEKANQAKPQSVTNARNMTFGIVIFLSGGEA